MYTPNVTLFRQFFMIHVKVHGDSNSWEKPTASGTKMEQWSATFCL